MGPVTYQVIKNQLQLNQNCTGDETGGNSGNDGIGGGGGASSGGGAVDFVISVGNNQVLTTD